MSLQTILFGDFVPPPIAQTRVVCKSGFIACKKYSPPPKREVVEKPACALIRKALANGERMSTEQVAKKAKLSGSYAYRVLCELKNKGELGCVPGPKPSGGGNVTMLFFLL